MSRPPIVAARPARFSPAALFLAAALLITAMVAGGHVPSAAAAGTASISGTVQAAGAPGVGVQGIAVLAILPSGGPGGSAMTDANGKYTITGVAAGSYTLDFEAGSGYAEQWWSGRNSQQTADFFSVAAGQTVTGKNATLVAPGSISGEVMGSGNPDVPLSSERVYLYGSTGVVANIAMTSGGAYSFTGLAAGTYTILFTAIGNYSEQWWFGAQTKAAATPITVGSGQNVTGISAVLSSGSTISGTVSAQGSPGAGLAGATVNASSTAGVVAQAVTDGSGRYTLEDLAAGTYTVEFLPGAGQSFSAQWWKNASSPSAATSITVGSQQNVPGINATLAAQSSVSGTVEQQGNPNTPVAGVNVNAVRSDGTYAGSNGVSDSAGNFTVAQLPAGSYTLIFTPNRTPGSEQNFAVQWWNGESSQAAANYFTVTGGQSATGMNAVMVPGATISGTVQGGSPAAALQGVVVGVYSLDGRLRGSVRTDALGHYSIDQLTAGTYAVKFAAPSPYDTEWSGGKPSLQAATPLTVTSGQTATEDAVLALGASVSGTLSYAGGAPAAGYVGVYDAVGPSDSLATLVGEATVANGKYTVSGLAPGVYKVGFTHDTTGVIARGPLPSSAPYASQWYQNAASYATGKALTLASGDAATGVNGKIAVLSGSPVRLHDYSGDGHPDVLARTAAGALLSYHGNGAGGWSTPASGQVGSGWGGLTAIVAPGDFNNDGIPDVITRDTTGALRLYPGNGSGGWGASLRIGAGWNGLNTIVGVGDFNADGNADLVARDASGRLWLYPGNGKGGFLPSKVIGWGWSAMTAIIGAGDFNGDGYPDLLARDSTGVLWLYAHTPIGWKTRVQVGSGWNAMTGIISVGDFNGDSHTDVVARDSAGLLWLYPGNGRSGWLTRTKIGVGWNAMNWIG
ncbi:hypothetical protein G3T36_03550 [Diaminobutyricibacter tongyongensis]|uniref:Uncharacterized protein n=1 Tax=Leifsonia tongyongensis TaxID=1268043 RepID=A0A6L9XU81_9MICO|nr:carboxypeptidase regulatory-like domain-containing protein [Diaminobutyricibacter tongyongensis]NEN04939.1 hypothetical protein [Diaminobutyricibacter tongyongensis]